MFRSVTLVRHDAPRRALSWAAVGVLLSAAAAPGLAIASPVVTADAAPAGQRVLQSVAVTMAPDGTLTDVSGTTVSTPSGSEEATSTEQTYSPQDVVGDLPVRVLAAYRTDEGAGTDLADLAGYTGRVEIDVTVQNLTMAPQTLTYDVDGSSRSRTALVGAPLTVVASTVLDGTDASAVVTPDTRSAGSRRAASATNGVLSQAADGTTQVQWATLLAPPQIGPSATLTLVVDAEDFQAPDFDLSVQPGLVTDPSVGALVDAAFQPGSSSELRLQARTIGLVGEVNTVLARAGETISKVRTTLDSSAETLGTKTVADLESSATGVASSMRGLDGSVKSLGRELSSSLDSTRSSALAQLLQTVTTLDRMLGDTSMKPHAAAVRGRGCETSVAAPGAAASVYGNIVNVAGQLSGFADATDSCKTTLQRSILDSVGPADPDVDKCRTAESVTCALFGARASFGKIAEDLVKSGDKALTALEPARITDAVEAATRLSGNVDTVITTTSNLLGAAPLGRVNLKIQDVSKALDLVRGDAQDLRTVVAGVHGTAVSARGEVAAMTTQNQALAAELCTMVGDGSEPDTLSAQRVEGLRSYLVAQSCPDAGGSTRPIGGPGTPMESRISAQGAAWDQIVAATDTADRASATGAALATLDGRIVAVREQLDLLKSSVQRDSGEVDRQIGDLDGNVKELQQARTSVVDTIGVVQQQQARAIADVKAAFESAAQDTSANVSNTVDPQIRQVTKRSQHSSETLGRMFDQSASGLNAAAGKIARDGASTLQAQKKSFAREQAAAGTRISGQVEQGLAGIARGVSSSTRDMEAAGALLTRDLNRVLLDLGDREVNGSGLLGSMTTGAATARSADYQLALATDRTTSYANVRSADIGGLLLRQAQSDAAFERQAALPAFAMDLPSGVAHRTVYTFHLGAGS